MSGQGQGCAYNCGGPKGARVGRHFSVGAKWKFDSWTGTARGDGAGYGVGDPLDVAMAETIRAGFHYVYIDNAYFIEGRERWFRATWDRYHHDGLGDYPDDRLKPFGLEIKPWRKDGRHILVARQTGRWYKVNGRPDWDTWVVEEIRKHTDRPIVERKKVPNGTFREQLKDCWAVVVPHSNATIEAVCEGVPVFATWPCAGSTMGSLDLSRIENPRYPEGRREWLQALSYNQFTLDEFYNGWAWRRLCEERERWCAS